MADRDAVDSLISSIKDKILHGKMNEGIAVAVYEEANTPPKVTYVDLRPLLFVGPFFVNGLIGDTD